MVAPGVRRGVSRDRVKALVQACRAREVRPREHRSHPLPADGGKPPGRSQSGWWRGKSGKTGDETLTVSIVR